MIVSLNNEKIKSFTGLSTDTKPTDCVQGSTFFELNTQKLYMFMEKGTTTAADKTWVELNSGKFIINLN